MNASTKTSSMTVKTTAISIVIAFGAAFSSVNPAHARSDWTNWQPQLGAIHRFEDSIDKQLNRDYKAGLIDSNEMAQLRRDLDGIRDQEDEFRVDHNGLGPKDQKCMMDKLIRFQENLDRATGDKFSAEVAVVDNHVSPVLAVVDNHK